MSALCPGPRGERGRGGVGHVVAHKMGFRAFKATQPVPVRRDGTEFRWFDWESRTIRAEATMKAKRPQRARAKRAPPCGLAGGLWKGFWKSLLLCCCGEPESLRREALVVVPVSESSSGSSSWRFSFIWLVLAPEGRTLGGSGGVSSPPLRNLFF